MLELKQHVPFGYFLDFHNPNPINIVLKKWVVELHYLFQLEDTTDGVARFRKIEMSNGVNRTLEAAKVLLWFVVAIGTSLALGQLN